MTKIEVNSEYPRFQFESDLYVSDNGQRHCERCEGTGTVFSGTNEILIPEPINNRKFHFLHSLEETRTGCILVCPCQDKNVPDHEDTYL